MFRTLTGFRCRNSHVIAALLLAGVFYAFSCLIPLSHVDVWAHLKYGEWIVQHGGVPDSEPFSLFADPEQGFADFQWLAQAALYIVYHSGALLAGGDELNQIAGGVQLLRLLLGLLVTLQVALLMLALRRSARSLPLAMAGVLLFVALGLVPAVVAYGGILGPRMFGQVLFAFLLWWVSGRRLSRWSLLVVPLLFVVWVNCDGSVVVGLTFLGLYCAGRLIEAARARASRQAFFSWHNTWLWQGMAAFLLALVAAAFFNPYGTSIYSLILQRSRHPNLITLPDWMPLDFSQSQPIYYATLLVLVLSQAVSPRSLPLARMILLIFFAVLPLYQKGLFIWWAMLVPWCAVPLWRHTLALARHNWRFRLRPTRATRWKSIAAATLLLGSFLGTGWVMLIFGGAPRPLTQSTTPGTLWSLAAQIEGQEEAAPALAQALRTYPGQRFQGRILAQHDMADYLVWALPEKAPVLVYSQVPAFSDIHWLRYRAAIMGRKGLKPILARFGVNLVVVDSNLHDALATALRQDPEWQVVRDDEKTAAQPRRRFFASMDLLVAVRKQPL